MIVVCVGVDYRTTPLAVRERTAFSIAEAKALLGDFAARRFGEALPLDELALLSTCNRVELYGAVRDESAITPGADAMLRLLSRARGDGSGDVPGDVAQLRYVVSGPDAERHLCRVAAGLESQILGEAEVLGQVADAFALARGEGATGPALEAICDAALRAGRRARTETSIGRNPASVSSVAADLALTLASSLHGRQLLLVGAGKMARIAAERLTARDVWTITIASRTLESAGALADRVGGEPIALDALPSALALADLVIACSAASEPIVSYALVRSAMRQRGDRPLVILDIAVPRDVDPAVRGIPGVRLFDVDELRPRVEASLSRRRSEIPRVAAIVEQEVQQLAARRHGAGLLNVVDAWRWSVEETRRREVQRALCALPDVDARVRESLERLSVSLVKRLLDGPSRRLRAEAANGHADVYAAFARRLFAGETGAEPSPATHLSPVPHAPTDARA